MELREITDTATTSLTVATWKTIPDNTSKYIITYTNKITEIYSGTDKNYIFFPFFS